MAEKVYCIIKRDKYYYIPVKARNKPYPGHEEEEAYLACLPNFFGGNKNHNETIEEALIREVREESQENIVLQYGRFEMGDPSFEFTDYKTIRKPDQPERTITTNYMFYLVTVNEEGMYFPGNCLDMNMHEPNAERREMSCILKVPVTNDLPGNDVDAFLQLCKDLGGDWVDIAPRNLDGKENTALSDWKAHQGTQNAFKVLFGLR